MPDTSEKTSAAIDAFQRLNERAQRSYDYARHYTNNYPIQDELKYTDIEQVILTTEEIVSAEHMLESTIENYNRLTNSNLKYVSFDMYKSKYGNFHEGTWNIIREDSRLVTMWCRSTIIQLAGMHIPSETTVINYWGDIVIKGNLHKSENNYFHSTHNELNAENIQQNISHHTGASAEDISHLLAVLLSAMSKQATKPEERAAVEEVENARGAADQGNVEKALGHLKAAGAWILEVAEQIGIGVAIAALTKMAGLQN